MKSLFILSLPRSLSSQVHAMACEALDLQSPAWTSAGEVLNHDRSVLSGDIGGGGPKFTTPRHADRFGPAQDFLTQIVATEGFAYKDVVQPFVASQWLRDHPGIAVLKIRPNIAHVAFAMIARRWLYPTIASTAGNCVEERMVSGLLRAAEALERVPGECVAYDDLVDGFEPLRMALSRLYPDRTIAPLRAGASFDADRAALLQRRSGPLYLQLQQVEQRMGTLPPAA